MAQTYLTKQGLKKLKEEYEQLINEGRRDVIERIKEAVSAGGYEDNPLYDLELEKQVLLEKKISELEEILREGKLIDSAKSGVNVSFVSIGASVLVESDGEKDKFKIVGSYEANPIKNLISNESPVGEALLGCRVGDVVEVTTPVVKLKYKILEISYD